MAMESATRKAARNTRTICVPWCEEEYARIVGDPAAFRAALDGFHEKMPELFPEGFADGYELKDERLSKKTQLKIRRVLLRNGASFSVRPSSVMPFMSGRTEDVSDVLFLRKFGVPYWGLARVFGRNPMYWYRLESSLGRNSIVGTTVRTAEIPVHLLADEHHQTGDGDKVFIATTVAAGCCLGAAIADSAGTDDLKEAYGVFRKEACDVEPDYAPETVNTDGWKATQEAWRVLFPAIALLRCFLHAWLSIRDRAKHLGDQFFEIGERVWQAYRAPNRRSFSQRIRSLGIWARQKLSGVVQEKVLDLCGKRDHWTMAYDHPKGHRTSNHLDRLMRPMNRYFDQGLHLHGKRASRERHCRAWALLYNFTPWHPAVTKKNDGWQSPAERLNQHQYHEDWLHNLLISASLGGYRKTTPQNA